MFESDKCTYMDIYVAQTSPWRICGFDFSKTVSKVVGSVVNSGALWHCDSRTLQLVS